jgi:hypothetical protein
MPKNPLFPLALTASHVLKFHEKKKRPARMYIRLPVGTYLYGDRTMASTYTTCC